jgi:hypothetical protein
MAPVLLLVFFGQAAVSASVKSPTFDEEFHVARAYAYVAAGDLRMQQNHPPLVSALSGLPLLLMPDLQSPAAIGGWDDAFLFTFADELFWRLGYDVDKILFLARLPIMLLGMLLGAFVYRWAREMYGAATAAVATTLYSFSPNLLAHTRLVTTDLAVTAFVFIAFYALWCYLRRPSAVRLLLAGLAVGLALSAKLSATLLVPLFVLLALLDAWRGNGRVRQGVGRYISALGRCALLFTVAGIVVWAFYRFAIGKWPGIGLAVPAPAYVQNFRTVIGHAERGHGAFLAGQVSMHGWWYYFPVTLLLKTPLPTLGLLGLAAWDTVRRKRWVEEATVLLFPTAYFIFALTSSLNIGYRYILPIAPFVLLYAGKVGSVAWLHAPWIRHRLLPALMLVYAGVTVWLHPHYLAYFNLLAGGPGGGYRYLVDSNLDWGQDLKLLKVFLDERDVDELWLGYFGAADPAYYGIRYRPIFPTGLSMPSDDFAPLSPAPGWYAISATVLQGPFSEEPDILDWFRRHAPLGKVGYSIFIYHVDPDPDPPTWVGICYSPVAPLDDREIAKRFGRGDLRMVGFDCEQAWVVPAGNRAGWYVVPLAADGSGTLAAKHVEEAPVVYRDRELRGGSGYTVYRWAAGAQPNLEGLVGQAWASPALAPISGEPRSALGVPAEVGGQVAFLGYSLSSATIEPGGEFTLTTAWRVIGHPGDPALSLFAHVVGAQGAISVGDALGYPAIQWSPGDVFVQVSDLSIPGDVRAGTYWVQVGLYSLATGERLRVARGDEEPGGRLLLAPVTAEGDRR